MSKEIEMKLQLLEELKKLMMGGTGDKLKPKAVEVEVMHLPKDAEMEEMPEDVETEDEENPKKKKTLREFLSSLD